ncbi:hypothetical protein [Kitasatospora sp. NPDC002040]|uniref:hypothetical protein n=1 Tax=Kitasatospora sp. NPDC002040 TaxID=3154661 RepID=UPI00332EFBA5
MTLDRRPLGLPVFSEPATDDAVVGGPRPAPVDRAVFLSPPAVEYDDEPAYEEPLQQAGGMTFSTPERQG